MAYNNTKFVCSWILYGEFQFELSHFGTDDVTNR